MEKFIANLTPRERKILYWAVPVILVLLVLTSARYLVTERAQVNGELDRALEDIAWLQAQRDALGSIRQGCPPVPWNEGSLKRLAAKYGVDVAPVSKGDLLELAVNAGHGNRVVSYLRELECQGARVEELTLETLDQQGAVKGRAVLQKPVT